MTFTSWPWWPSPFYLVLFVLLFHVPKYSFPCLSVLATVFATVQVTWEWITIYRLKYLFRSCLASCLLLHLVQMTLPYLYPDVQEKMQSVLLPATLAMTVLRIFWTNPLEITRAPLDRSKGRIRKTGDPDGLPPVFPNGWFSLGQSSLVPKEGVVPISVLGQKLVLFRGSSGQLFVLDAYCPHLGADLGEKGRVEGDCITCPFHGWKFRGNDGMCSHIPNSSSIPSLAKVSPWRCAERNGSVYVWYHAEGEEPDWEVPPIPEVENGTWKYRGKTEHTVYCHIQEIPENGADVAHLSQLHSHSVFSGAEWMTEKGWFDHLWTPDWRPDEERVHVGRMTLSQRCSLFGVLLPLGTINMEIQQIGPAVVQMHLKTWFFEGVFLQHVIPEGPLTMRVQHLLYTETTFFHTFAYLLIWAEAFMFDRDVAVWNHKRLLSKPVLVREDTLIARYRRWFSQFYSPSSPTLREVMDRKLDW